MFGVGRIYNVDVLDLVNIFKDVERFHKENAYQKICFYLKHKKNGK